MSSLDRLRELLASDGDLLAEALRAEADWDAEPSAPAALAASGPRAVAAPLEYELLVEAIYEGYLLHYGTPRLLSAGDGDLALLAGDRLYALGLERLVALGDLDAVRELADVIALCALVAGRGEPELFGPLWLAGARAVGWGPSEQHARAKALLRAGDPTAPAAMSALSAAWQR